MTRRKKILFITFAVLAALSGAMYLNCRPTGERHGIVLSVPVITDPQIVNVKSFGAACDGVTDDRVAITNALAAAAASTSKELFFPPGTCLVSRSGSNPFALDVPADNLVLRGVHGKSIIKHVLGMPNAQVDILRVNLRKNVVIRDLVFDGNWGNCVTRITLSSNNVALSAATTINVDDASCFPSGTFGALITDDKGPEYISCTGKTATTFTGCTASAFAGGAAIGTLFVDQRVGYVDFQAGINHTTQANTGHDTTIAAGSNGAVLPQSTINVVDASGFSYASGTELRVKTSLSYQKVTCTGSTATSFTGCTGGTGTLATGYEVFDAADPKNMALRIRGSENILVQDVDIRDTYGDCIWLGTGTSGGISAPDRNITIRNVTCKIAARDGIAFGSGVDGANIDNFFAQDIHSSAIDAEPVSTGVRNINIGHSTIGTWFSSATHSGGGNSISIVGGLDNNVWTDAQTARGWHVHDNMLLGTLLIERAGGAIIENNDIRTQNTAGTSPIMVEFSSHSVSILNNRIYTSGDSSGTEGGGDIAAVQVWAYQSGAFISAVSSLEIAGNWIRAVNGRHGISIKGGGNRKSGDSGTATGASSTTLTDTGKSWATNQWNGYQVRMGAATAVVDSNTATVLTLNPGTGVSSVSWVDGLGAQASTPSPGAYQILLPTGIVAIHDNHVDLTDNGKGKGKYGINVTNGSNNDTSLRVQIRRNHVRNCDTHAIRVKFDATTAYPLVEVTDNDAHDDQPISTCTNLLRIDNPLKADQLIIGGNERGEGVSNHTSNLSAGTWLVADGQMQAWAGYGSPESVVSAPVGSTYQRVDGSGVTAGYLKTSGSSNTGWLPAGGAVQAITAGNGITQSGTVTPTLSVTGLAASANNSIFTSNGSGVGSWATTATLTTVTVGSTILSSSAPSANVGSLGTGSTNFWGNVTGIGANTAVTLTFGGGGFGSRSWCIAIPNSNTISEHIYVTNSSTAPVFNCVNTTTGAAANCNDFTYTCAGQ